MHLRLLNVNKKAIKKIDCIFGWKTNLNLLLNVFSSSRDGSEWENGKLKNFKTKKKSSYPIAFEAVSILRCYKKHCKSELNRLFILRKSRSCALLFLYFFVISVDWECFECWCWKKNPAFVNNNDCRLWWKWVVFVYVLYEIWTVFFFYGVRMQFSNDLKFF